ncbi:winged helix-turn-helix domain-containing protein [Draconibacterium sediminis]|uniref:winged helix-turn-helix domain-containing protein n=1 Tax=Draconibacterium sediminis TaxID=1544798 RepID=UPI0026F116F2|nr:LysR family transcriptional regulator [Draconibacterium sediminis]
MTKVDLQIHISDNDKLIVNPERVQLLRMIASTGSLLKASEKMGISYNKTWKLLEAVNAASTSLVLEKARGGKGGGGAVLTDYGRFLLKEYEAIEKVVSQFTKKLNTEINI